jgi:hypothetical protein
MVKDKKKNHQKGKSSVRLLDAVLQYHAKNYSGALTRLKNAEIRPGEEQKAKNLEIAVLLRLAYVAWQNCEYSKAIDILKPLLPEHPIAVTLAGMSHLYHLDFKSAIPLLKKSAATHPSFSFYYLLAEIYLQQEIDFKGFTNYFNAELQQCSESQKSYIQIIIDVFNNQIEAALNQVLQLKSQSHVQHLNFDAFKSILTGHPLSYDSLSDKVKPLYRLILNGYLTDFEKIYFNRLTATVPEISDVVGNQTNITPALQKELEAQYHHQKVLSEPVLAQIMQAVPAEQRPYIAYNQAVNALNLKDFDAVDKGIKHVVVKYASDIILIPESLPMYLQLYDDVDIKVYPATFWQFVGQWLSVRKENLTVDNLDDMGWAMFEVMFKHPTLFNSSHTNEPVKISEQYPSMFALKYFQILFPKTQFDANKITDSRLDFLSLPNAEKHKELFANKFDLLAGMLSPFSGLMNILNKANIPKSAFIQQIVYYAECFMVAVTKYPIPPHNSIAMEAFKCVHKFLKEILEHDGELPKGFYDKFLKTYTDLAKQFEKHPDIGEYTQDIQSARNAVPLKALKEITRYVASAPDFLKYFKTYRDIQHYDFIWEYIREFIDRSHFMDSLPEMIVNLMEAMYLYQNNIAESEREFNHFMKVYKKEIEKYNCEHPTVFFGLMVKYLVKNKNLPPQLVYRFAVQYIEELTLKHETEAKQYNAVADFLEFVKAQYVDLRNDYDGQLIQKLKTYLIKINKIKNIKKLDTTIKKVASLP